MTIAAFAEAGSASLSSAIIKLLIRSCLEHVTCRVDARGSPEGIAVHKLAKLYKQLADTERAAHFYTFHLKRLDEEQSQGQDVAEALEFLATYNKVQLLPPVPIIMLSPSDKDNAL